MNIQIKDLVGFSADDTMKIVRSLMDNRKPKEGSFDYGLETHGAIGIVFGLKLDYPIQARQTNKRKSDKSPIIITIERHRPI